MSEIGKAVLFHSFSPVSNMSLKSPQAKGKRFEYFIRDLLKGYGYEARRTPLSGAIDGWSGDITSNFPYFIECKNTVKTVFPSWWKKANDESGSKPPIILWNYKGEAYAFLLFTDLLNREVNGKDTRATYKKPSKPIKQSVLDSANLSFSKMAQTHRIEKLKKSY